MKLAGASLITLNGSLSLAEEIQENGLSLAQEQALAYLWNYEKMQKDVFTQLHASFNDLTIYETFANYSKVSQRAVVEEVVKLYQVAITNTGTGLILATETELRNMSTGEFGLSELTSSYDAFMSEGSSQKDALLVGAKAVVQEINKIDDILGSFPNNAKIRENLEYLKSSSMGQYWRIDHELKANHSSEGCCEAGSAYCKTKDEYPVSYGHEANKPAAIDSMQKKHLVHMWSEEKMAHDAYEIAYTLYPDLRLFYNIGHWSENQHMHAVEELIALYDINVYDYSDAALPDAHYDASVLRAIPPKEYPINKFTDTLNDLLADAAGDSSATDKDKRIGALQLGCRVEIQDIIDLRSFLEINNNKYIEETFKYLIAGSQSHYWSFHYALIAMGCPDGCGSAGDDYKKTAEDFPSGSGDITLARLWNQRGSYLDEKMRFAHLLKSTRKKISQYKRTIS